MPHCGQAEPSYGRFTWCATPPTAGWTSTGSARICAAISAPPGGEDLDSAGSSGVAGTPTFFINGHRQCCAYDIDTLTAAVTTAKAQAQLDVPNRPRSGRPQAG